MAELSDTTHINDAKIKITVEKLVESGLIEAIGNGRSRYYTLSAKIYKQSDNIKGYVRQTGIDKIRYPEMIIKFAENNNGRIARKEAAELLKINEAQAYRLLKKMADEGRLSLVGKGKFAYYKTV